MIGGWVWRKPMEGASIVRTLGVRRLESKSEADGFPGGLTTENATDNAHIELIGSPARSQAKQARGLTAVHLRRLIGRKD